jgi:tetratricopeptide (TPR) repeat protein
MKEKWRALVLAFGLVLPLGPAAAQDRMDGCDSRKTHIGVCTRLIKSGKFRENALARLYWNRGNAYARLDKYRDAVADYDRAIEADWRFAYAYFARGLIYQYAFRQRRLAVRDFRAAYELQPWVEKFADKLLSLGFLVPLRPRL